MRKVYAHLSIGYPTACQDAELEFEDEVTDEEIDEAVNEWAYQYIECTWSTEPRKIR